MTPEELEAIREAAHRDNHDGRTSSKNVYPGCARCDRVALLAEVDRLNVAHAELIVKYSAARSTVDRLASRVAELEAEQAALDAVVCHMESGTAHLADFEPWTAAYNRHRARTESEER